MPASTCWERITIAEARVRRAELACAARRPSSVKVGGIRMSTMATSGACSATAA